MVFFCPSVGTEGWWVHPDTYYSMCPTQEKRVKKALAELKEARMRKIFTKSAVRDLYRAHYATLPLGKLPTLLRDRCGNAFRRIARSKPAKTEELLGCTWQRAKCHIEKQFTDNMSWDNHGEWHIDHIIPLSSAYDEYTLSLLCHFTNLKPMWAKDNLSKSDNWHPPEYCI